MIGSGHFRRTVAIIPYISAALSIPIAMFFVVVGAHDGVAALRGIEQAIGIITLLTSATMLYGGVTWLATRQRGNAKNRVAICLSVGIVPGLVFGFIQVATTGHWTWKVAVWIAMAAVPAIGAVTLFMQGARIAFGPAGVAAVGVIAALAAALVPVGANAVRPPSEASVLNIQVVAAEVGSQTDPKLGAVAVVSQQVTIKNISGQRLLLMGDAYDVLAYQTTAQPNHTTEAYQNELRTGINNPRRLVDRYEYILGSEVVEAGYINLPGRNFLDPDQQIVTTKVTLVPLSSGNIAGLGWKVATAFADRLPFESTNHSPSTFPGVGTGDYDIVASSTSWTAWLTTGPQELKVDYQSDESGYFGFKIVPAGHDVDVDSLSRRYGIFYSTAATELALAPAGR